MRCEIFACILVDHRADIGREMHRIAEREFVHRAEDEIEHLVGDIVLQEQHAQRRAALARAVEGRRDHILANLFGQRGGIHDHRVLPAGFRDQRRYRAIARGERAVDGVGRVGRAGERDAREARIAEQGFADARAITRQQMQHIQRHARFMQQPHGCGSDQRRLLGGLCKHGISRRERARDLPGENRQRKIPRR